MKSRAQLLIFFSMVLGLSGCHFGTPKKPTGQVVATVGSREITRRELQAELNNAPAVNAAARKAQQQVALQRIVNRVIVANAAKDQGLDKDPSFALLSQRSDEALLVQLLESKIAASVPLPSNEEAEQFKQANPDIFSERKTFDVDQIRMPRPEDPKFVTKLEPLKTLDDIASFLSQNHVAYQRGTNVMDAVGQNPKLVHAILALPPHEVFILSSGNEVFINEIRETHISPFTGEPATKYALNTLKSQHIQEAIQKQLTGLLAKARGSVQINKDMEPSKEAAPKAQPH